MNIPTNFEKIRSDSERIFPMETFQNGIQTTDKLTELPINFVLIPTETKFIPIETKFIPIETKFIPIETKKKFSVQSNFRCEVQIRFDKPTDKRTFEQKQKRLISKRFQIDLRILNFYNFIQCNTIVQLTNYSYIIIKNNACTFHKLQDNRKQRRNILRLEQPNKYFLFNSYNIA